MQTIVYKKKTKQCFSTQSAAETEALGEALAKAMKEGGAVGGVIALYGEVGVGKTAFVRGFCRHFGILRTKSPTYTVVNEYNSPLGRVYHFDLYRLRAEEDLYAIGFEDYLQNDAFLLIEWPRIGEGLFAPGYTKVEILRTDEGDNRWITIAYDA